MATALALSLGSYPLPLGFPVAFGHFALHSLLTFDSLHSEITFSEKQSQKLLLAAKLHPGSTLAFPEILPSVLNKQSHRPPSIVSL